jgi:hypothetical protein
MPIIVERIIRSYVMNDLMVQYNKSIVSVTFKKKFVMIIEFVKKVVNFDFRSLSRLELSRS